MSIASIFGSFLLLQNTKYQIDKQMIQQKQFKLPDAKKPILILKQLPQLKDLLQNNAEYFLCSTLDKQIYLIEYNLNKDTFLSYSYELVLRHLPTQLYIDSKSNFLYVGFINGDLQWFNYIHRLQKKNRQSPHKTNQQQKNMIYRELQPSIDSKIMLIYTRANYIFAWDASSRVKKISVTTGQLLQAYNFGEDYCSSTFFKNPFTHNTVGCISLLNKEIPIIMDCDTKTQFLNSYELSLVYSSEQTEQVQQNRLSDSFIMSKKQTNKQQITMMKPYYDQSSQIMYIIASVYSKAKDKYYLVIYEVIRDQSFDLCLCQLLVKFPVKEQITNIHIKDNLIMLTMWENILFIKFYERELKAISPLIHKSGLNLSWGFILVMDPKNSTIKFMFEKGFNFMKPNESKTTFPKLRVKTKAFQWPS